MSPLLDLKVEKQFKMVPSEKHNCFLNIPEMTKHLKYLSLSDEKANKKGEYNNLS